MADGLLPINFVVNEKYLAFSETNPRKILLPAFYQEDTIQMRFKALKHTSDKFPFLEKLNLTGYALQVSVGSVGSIMANNLTWNLVDNGYALEGNLNLNTGLVLAALTADSVQLRFEILLILGGVPYRMHQSITVNKSVALAGAPVAPPNDAALGVLVAQRTYAPLNDCPGIVFVSPAGKRFELYIDDNGAVLADPLN